MAKRLSSAKSDFSDCATVISPPNRKNRRQPEEENEQGSSSVDDSVVRIFPPHRDRS